MSVYRINKSQQRARTKSVKREEAQGERQKRTKWEDNGGGDISYYKIR